MRDRKAMAEFVDLPYALYRDDPYWVPPLRIAQKQILDTRKHPFYAHAGMQCFLARSGKRTVGRIAAIVDHKFNEFHDGQFGFFGFLEMIGSQPVAEALLGAAREWLQKCGARTIWGPMNPSTNYECGLLVEGFHSSPRIMMTYNPPEYAAMLERAGLRKAKDLFAYNISATGAFLDRAERIANRALRLHGVLIRSIRMKNFQDEVELVWSIYNSAWSRNWGFVPMTREEFLHSAKDMKSVLIPDFVLIGEVGGRPVGFALALPDINQALKHTTGRLFPVGLLKILYYQRLVKNLRVIALGVVEEFRTAGVAAGFYAELIRNARKLGYQECELSWVLEDNVLMNRSVEALGARCAKIYRIYEWN